MKSFKNIMSVILLMVAPVWAIGSEEKKMSNLDQRQQAIIPIAAFTADGDLERLKPALTHGLEAGLTVNEVKEIFAHLYAYVGFPRALNGQATFMGVMADRKAKGIEDAEGKEASPVPPDFDKNGYGGEVRAKLAGLDKDITGAPWQEFSPIMDTYLKEHLFADIFVRDVLSHQERELVTIAALANLSGAEGQLAFHLGGAMNTGFSPAQMQDFIVVMSDAVGEPQGGSAQKVLDKVLNEKGEEQ